MYHSMVLPVSWQMLDCCYWVYSVLQQEAPEEEKIWIGTYDFWAGPPCPPLTPLLVPALEQKGYQSAHYFNRHPSAYSSRPEIEVLQSYGAKIEIRTPMHT
jgi:hypothetical protein